MTTTDDAPLLLSLADVARLAGVQRPVSTMWRSRSRGTAHPFPAAVTRRGNQDLFAVDDIAAWLDATGRGNNPEADRDAAAYLGVANLDATELTAVLALRTLAGHLLTGLAAEDLLDLADSIDPDDAFLYRELDGAAGRLPHLARIADRMADAAYSPAEAFENILVDRFRAGLDAYARTGLSQNALDLAAQVALTLAETTGAGRFVEATEGGSDLILAVVRALGESDGAELDIAVQAAHTEHPTVRLAQRRLRVATAIRDDLTVAPEPPHAAAPRLVLAQYPGPASPEASATDILHSIDELALSLGRTDAALVIGPSPVLVGPLDGEADQQRSQTLRLGRVRAVVGLGPGLSPARVRQPLALWVLGADQRDLPIAERRTMVADLGSAGLDASSRQDLITDLAASLGGPADVKAHAFRFARLVRTSALVADGGSLTARSRRTVPAGPTDASTGRRSADRLVQSEQLLAQIRVHGTGSLPFEVGPGADQPAEWTTLGALLSGGSLRYLPGTRLRQDEFVAEGLRVLDAPAPTSSRDLEALEPSVVGQVHHLQFADRHPSAQVTEPGDVVFRTGPIPSAGVDRLGTAAVRTPARALRIRPGTGLVPDVLAADLSNAPAGPWRNWSVRRFTPETADRLAAALDAVADARTVLDQQLSRLHHLSDLLTAGTAAGDLQITPASEAPKTEGND